MSEVITLGTTALPLQVVLTSGSDFYCVLDTDTPLAATDVLELRFGSPVSTTWTATIDPGAGRAVFDVDKAITDTITDGTPARLVHTTAAGRDQVWMIGVVRRG